MTTRQVTTQAELDQALADGVHDIDLVGDGYFEVHASGSATVHAYGSATVRAYGSATVRASGSATVHAFGSATVHAYDSATVHASDLVAVQDHGPKTKVAGGVVIPIRTPETMTDWCSYYGVTVARGWATVYKAVQNDLTSVYGFAYPIGTEVACTDWSDTKACGQGLHFSPRPWMALKYADGPRFLAVKVKVAECVVLDDKIKAPRCKVIGEVDEDGEPVG